MKITKSVIKFAVLAVCVLAMVVSVCPLVKADGLTFDGNGYRYVNPDGSYAKNCRKCVNFFALHFDDTGYADKTGFDACAGQWKNTKKGKRFFFDDGKVPYGSWLLADGNYYTFDNGYVVSNSSNNSTSKSTSKNSTSKTNNAANSNTAANATEQASDTAENTTVNTTEQAYNDVLPEDADRVWVYTTSDKLYHKTSGCSNPSTPMTMKNAVENGFKKCGKCW